MKSNKIADIYNYRVVDEKLVTSGQPSAAQLAAVAEDGFKVVINLALHDDPRYSLPDEPGLVQSLGMDYLHIPVEFDAPMGSDLLRFFDAMQRHEGKKRLVHCAANMRVSAFMGLYGKIVQGRPDDEAFALMKSVWEPDAIWTEFISLMLKKQIP